MRVAPLEPSDQFANGVRLIAKQLEVRDESKGIAHGGIQA